MIFLPKIAKNDIFIKKFNFLAKIIPKNRSFRGSHGGGESLFFWLRCEGGVFPLSTYEGEMIRLQGTFT